MRGDCKLGDTLRLLYALYGSSNEGPHAEDNVEDMIDGFLGRKMKPDEDFETNVSLLLADSKTHACYEDLRHVIKQIEAIDHDLLLHFVAQNKESLQFDIDLLVNGTEWMLIAQQTREVLMRNPEVFPMTGIKTAHGIPIWRQWVSAEQATLIQLMYIGLVFMRGDSMLQSFRNLSGVSNHPLDSYHRLFSHEVIRHMRNALAHGHVRPWQVGFLIRDREFLGLITPRFAMDICLWIQIFYVSLLSATSASK